MQQLTTHEGSDEEPSWSPDGRKIAFRSDRSGNFDIWVMDADGGQQQQLTTHESGDFSPCWSPDGQRIAFASEKIGNIGNRDIWVMDADGGNMRQITAHNALDSAPSWSPDGKKIAFYSDRSGNRDIWVMDANGGNLQKLTTYKCSGSSPSWSPDGRKIAFYSTRSGNYDIWVMDANGGNLQKLTTHDAIDYSPEWSPDGRKIAFYSERNGGGDIWMMDANGGNLQKLTTYKCSGSSPSWSPDGRKIAFQSLRPDYVNYNIWVMELEGVFPGANLRATVLNTAIVEFQEKGSLGIKDAGAIVAEWMSSSLYKTQVFDIYERVLLYKILEEQDLGLTGALDEKTTAEIGKLYGVEAIVTGTVSKFGSTISVVAKLIDTETAKVIASSDVKTTSVDEIPGAMDRLAQELAKEP